ncbi:type 4a pilus biogenesis protein PilO [Thiovibrio sp. JS02]
MALDIKKLKAGFENFLDSKVSRLEGKQKLLICAAAWLIPCVAFFFLVYSPKNDEIKQLEKKKAGIEQEIAKVEAVAKQLAKHRAEMQEVELQFKAASLLLPEQKEIPSLLTNISGLGTASGLDFLSFKPAGESPKQFYAEIPVNIAVNGSYHSVGVFLDKISKLPRIVTVNDVKMGSPKQTGTEMVLNTTFKLVTYRFIEPVAEDPKAAAKGKAKKR